MKISGQTHVMSEKIILKKKIIKIQLQKPK